MSYWPSPEDQQPPCRCGCGLDATYVGGTLEGYNDQSCFDKDYQMALKKDVYGIDLPKYDEGDLGNSKSSSTQDAYNRAQLRQKAAKARMLGFEGDARRIESMIQK